MGFRNGLEDFVAPLMDDEKKGFRNRLQDFDKRTSTTYGRLSFFAGWRTGQ